jgi:hypothetical protein
MQENAPHVLTIAVHSVCVPGPTRAGTKTDKVGLYQLVTVRVPNRKIRFTKLEIKQIEVLLQQKVL